MPLYKWSPTAAANATADPSINWAEGQAPSSVNDSARAMMARVAEYRDDVSGLLVTGGTPTAYTLATNQVFDSAAHMHGREFCFIPINGNGDNVTLNIDSIGAYPIVSNGVSAPLPAGTLIPGTPYKVMFTTFDNTFRLTGLFGNPYNIPIAGGMDYWGSSAPNSNFAFPIGQAISRTTYVTLFAIIGTTYGVGDGSTTFNLPDKTGRVSAMKEASASRLTSTYFGGNSANLGATGGGESHTLTTAELAAHSHANSLTDPGHSHIEEFPIPGGGTTWNLSVSGATTGTKTNAINGVPIATDNATTGISITNASAGSGNAHAIVQPTIICNYIMRII